MLLCIQNSSCVIQQPQMSAAAVRSRNARMSGQVRALQRKPYSCRGSFTAADPPLSIYTLLGSPCHVHQVPTLLAASTPHRDVLPLLGYTVRPCSNWPILYRPSHFI